MQSREKYAKEYNEFARGKMCLSRLQLAREVGLIVTLLPSQYEYFTEENDMVVAAGQVEKPASQLVVGGVGGQGKPAIALRILMERHKVFYSAVNDLIAFVNLKPDVQRVRNAEDFLQRPSLSLTKKMVFCEHCCEAIEEGSCGDE